MRALSQSGTPALQYGWVEGSETLRSSIASRLRTRGAEIAAADVIITSGAQQALAIALELVARPGARIGVDLETYPAALGLMRARRLVPVTFDDKAAVFTDARGGEPTRFRDGGRVAAGAADPVVGHDRGGRRLRGPEV